MREIKRVQVSQKSSSLLWTIKNNFGHESYLFGTMHVRSQVAHQFLSPLEQYVSKADVYAAEMNLAEFDPQVMQDYTILPEQHNICTLVKPKKWRKLRKSVLKSFEIDLDMYSRRHPFLISTIIAESLLTNDEQESLDQAMWAMAERHSVPCTGLESFQDQMQIMKQISVDESVKQILDIGRHPQRFRRNMSKMIDHYVAQDITKLYKASRLQLQGLRKKLLFDRNIRMAERMRNLMAGQTTVFAAVGAAHLAGKKGMLPLLKKMGCKIYPIKIKDQIET
jgi:uncharacterized protein YbaP (TraB family)